MAKANWANRTIFEGDNLDILRGMNSASVDLAYLDPPFNSNRNYSAPIGSAAAGAAFKDTWTLSDLDVAWLGLIADQEPALYRVIEAAGFSHGKGMKSYLVMMAVRLLELKRILKATGSIYLHCDPTASHYLKMLMDSIFGRDNFRNELVWRRTSTKSFAKKFAVNSDRVLYYALSGKAVWNQQYEPYSQAFIASQYRNEDEYGRWATADLTGGKPGGPEAYLSFRGVLPPSDRAWAPPGLDRIPSSAHARLPADYAELDQLSKCEALDDAGLIYWSSRGKPYMKKYLSLMPGVVSGDLVLDIPPVKGRERTGYPTQKPLALLERIVQASTNEGDVVLDPFCGCATTCVSAEMLGRQWVGIDLSPLAGKIVVERLQKVSDEDGLLKGGKLPKVIHRTDLPRRTDIEALPDYRTHKHVLYGEQAGNCKGCGVHFPFQNMTVDHITPRAKGGGDHKENLQLLCNSCNARKGSGTQAELIVRLREAGILYRAV